MSIHQMLLEVLALLMDMLLRGRSIRAAVWQIQTMRRYILKSQQTNWSAEI